MFILFYLIWNMALWNIFILTLFSDRFKIVLYLFRLSKTPLRFRCPLQPSFNYPFPVTFHFFYYFSTSNTVLYYVGNKVERILALFILSSNEVKRCLFQLLFTSCTMYFLFFLLFFSGFSFFFMIYQVGNKVQRSTALFILWLYGVMYCSLWLLFISYIISPSFSLFFRLFPFSIFISLFLHIHFPLCTSSLPSILSLDSIGS